jgi:cell division protease FtsH
MSLKSIHHDLAFFLSQSKRILDEPVRPLQLDYRMLSHLNRHVRRVRVHGVGPDPEIRTIHHGPVGWSLQYGLIEYELRFDDRVERILQMSHDYAWAGSRPLDDLWAVPERVYVSLYRFLRKKARTRTDEIVPPIMEPADAERLWNNTIGFLQKGEQALRQFGVALKRGVLLQGTPGNGKTMASRWLATQCEDLGLEWRTVTAENYEAARGQGRASCLFQLHEPGIIFFDDLDGALRDRTDIGMNADHSTFLSELDGLDLNTGVVYLFTSNAPLNELDPAFRRPGRIDQVISFGLPSPALRERLIRELWPEQIVQAIDVDRVVDQTDGFSFAEVDELKKLMVLHYLDSSTWDWDLAWDAFQTRASAVDVTRPLGFVAETRSRRNGSRHSVDVQATADVTGRRSEPAPAPSETSADADADG